MSEPQLLVDIHRTLPAFRLNLHLEVGREVLVLFGPSGSGKSMTLESIAGLVTPDQGEISLDGKVFFRRGTDEANVNLPARRRGVGYVFQSYALFPHLTVLGNVRYPLGREAGAERRARELIEQMGLGQLGDRLPHQLSGGQQQRVAIARALARDPEVLLLDEPFSALDPGLRERLRTDLRALQLERQLIVICVTHNVEDAFALGDRLAVLRDGELEQVGAVAEVFQRPTSMSAAEVLGIRNIFHARVASATADRVLLDWDGIELYSPAQPCASGDVFPVYVAPEDVKLLYPDRPVLGSLAHNQLDATVLNVQHRHDLQIIRLLLANGHQLEARGTSYFYQELDLSHGAPVRITLRLEGLKILHEEDAC
ncbi:MAG: ABC transporter ATP-binding protein [Anaerolineae bacterium]